MKRVEDMTEPELRDLMNRVARAVRSELPTGALFAVLVFDDPRVAQYVSNCRREDMVLALKESAERIGRRQDVTR